MGFFERNADRLGTGGSLFAALCCLGTPSILAVLSAVGAGFLVNDFILLPLLAVSLLVALWGLEKGARVHEDRWPLRAGATGALLISAGIFVGAWPVAAGAGLLIGATIWNLVARRRCDAGRMRGNAMDSALERRT
jgi:mercuric ion transport protein